MHSIAQVKMTKLLYAETINFNETIANCHTSLSHIDVWFWHIFFFSKAMRWFHPLSGVDWSLFGHRRVPGHRVLPVGFNFKPFPQQVKSTHKKLNLKIELHLVVEVCYFYSDMRDASPIDNLTLCKHRQMLKNIFSFLSGGLCVALSNIKINNGL